MMMMMKINGERHAVYDWTRDGGGIDAVERPRVGGRVLIARAQSATNNHRDFCWWREDIVRLVDGRYAAIGEGGAQTRYAAPAGSDGWVGYGRAIYIIGDEGWLRQYIDDIGIERVVLVAPLAPAWMRSWS